MILPGFLTFYLLALAGFMPYMYTPIVFLVLAGVLQTVGAWMGPETRDVDIASEVAPAAARERSPRKIAPA